VRYLLKVSYLSTHSSIYSLCRMQKTIICTNFSTLCEYEQLILPGGLSKRAYRDQLYAHQLFIEIVVHAHRIFMRI
jgi:hypothetical protein